MFGRHSNRRGTAISPNNLARDLPFKVGFYVDTTRAARNHHTPMFAGLRNTIAQLERGVAE